MKLINATRSVLTTNSLCYPCARGVPFCLDMELGEGGGTGISPPAAIAAPARAIAYLLTNTVHIISIY